MTCQMCGHTSPSLSAFCTECGQPQQLQAAFAASAGGAQPFSPRINEGLGPMYPASVPAQADTTPYAPFLSRFLAFLLDAFIAGLLAAITYGLMAAMAAMFTAASLSGGRGGYPGSEMRTGVGVGVGVMFIILGGVLAIVVYALYFVNLETSSRQATFGKSLLGIKVVTVSGGTISIGQSLGRLLIKNTISGAFFGIGFLMAAFTQRKQALHDFLAATIVTKS